MNSVKRPYIERILGRKNPKKGSIFPLSTFRFAARALPSVLKTIFGKVKEEEKEVEEE